MTKLLRNCAHGSEFATWFVADQNGSRFVKVALTPDGRRALENEVAGWTWYQSWRAPTRPQICRVLRRDPHVVRIEIDQLHGRQGRAADGVAANAALLNAAIAQYCDLWPAAAEGDAPMHGDLSCDNLIDTPDGLFIIDWESFRPAAAPWGFDALYLLFETLYFDINRGARPTEADFATVGANIVRLHQTGRLASHALGAPLASTVNFIRTRGELWGADLARHPLKLPIVRLSDADIRALEAGVQNVIQRTI